MALPGHSPPNIYTGSGSPPRVMNGHNDNHLPPSMYGPHRSMLPPSPQHYQPRFPNTSVPTPSPSLTSLHETRAPPPPHKRPGSSMSISSMLGGEPERPSHEPYQNQATQAPSRQISSAPMMSFNGAMSPPQQPAKPNYINYNYKTRSRTPDRLGQSFDMGPTRQRSSSSGVAMQRPAAFGEPHDRLMMNTSTARYNEQSLPHSFGIATDQHDQEEKARRTSLSGILQRPSSQPQPGAHISQPLDTFRSQTVVSTPFDRNQQPAAPKRNGTDSLYDTRPPGTNGINKPSAMSNHSPPRSSPQSLSPELRRPSLNGIQSRGLATILNGPTSQPMEPGSQRMSRQDSTQSQGERSVLGERNKIRAYSPFASSFTSGTAIGDAQGRKGSDELSQHRAILGLAAENKRGRFSPMPQAVQGAQAQTPQPDAGIKTEHGRVFSGIGSGIGSTPTPVGLSSSPFKKNDGPMRLSEDNLKSFSRSTPGPNKRSRKARDDEGQADPDTLNGEKAQTNGRKRNKQQHNYKADLEEMATSGLIRRNTPLSNLNTVRRTSTPVNTNASTSQGHQNQRYVDPTPVFRPSQTIRLGPVFAAASRNPRRHLGSFVYRPKIAQLDSSRINRPKFDISITPNLLPSFSDVEQINCTYTVHVPRIWLQPRERGLICMEQCLWGSGIYTDDSDPVAAAMHTGFLQASLGEGVDTALLGRIVHEQNPKLEFLSGFGLPEQPREVEQDKDMNITLVVLPQLEKYDGSARFGIRSRTWPEGSNKTRHDGVSFAVLNIDFVDVGIEEIRVGRTGQGRRERLRMDLEARRNGLEIQKQKIERAKKRQLERLKKHTILSTGARNVGVPRSVPISISTEMRLPNTKTVVSQPNISISVAAG